MRVRRLHILCAAMLGLFVLVAAANVAQAAARLGPSCCDRAAPANSMTAPDSPCHGFLPLTCCHAAALPGGDHSSVQAPAAFAIAAVSATLALTPAAAIPRCEGAALGPSAAATRLTVVRQI